MTSFSASRRDKGFVTGDAAGGVEVHYATTGKSLLSLASGTAALGRSSSRRRPTPSSRSPSTAVSTSSLSEPPPRGLVPRALREDLVRGVHEPDYVWQSTGGTDDFEAKLSLTPLIYGTLKGTFYALFLAIPIALPGALYTAQFMHPDLKAVVKPVVEVMAALPSVVLGFIAGLWLAPESRRSSRGPPDAPRDPFLAMLGAAAWAKLPREGPREDPHGWEAILLVPLVIGGGALASSWAGAGADLLRGDYRHWLLGARR